MKLKFWIVLDRAIPYTFLIFYTLLLLFLIIGLVFQEKGNWELWINSQHHPFLDLFFKTITNLGDGLVAVFLIIPLILRRYANGVLLALGFFIHAILVHLGKKVFFNGSLRPLAYFADMELHKVSGVKTAFFNTFPSGHTASIFLFIMILLLTHSFNKIWQVSLLMLAVLVAFSRVYLLQHFVWDVFAGSLVGVFSAFAAFYWINFFPFWPWMNKRLKIDVTKLKWQVKPGWKRTTYVDPKG